MAKCNGQTASVLSDWCCNSSRRCYTKALQHLLLLRHLHLACNRHTFLMDDFHVVVHAVSQSDPTCSLDASRVRRHQPQGCNSHVFRVALRARQQDQHASRRGAGSDNADPASVASPSLPSALSGRGAKSEASTSTATKGGKIVSDLIDVGEQFWKGSFGACLGGNYGGVDQGSAEGKGPPLPDKAGDDRAETEWALKMALTLAGQHPQQAEQEMKTEIAVLVGGRVPPHANIMRGVHSFQDDIGHDLQPVLWAGLGPTVGETLSSRTFFVVMPLFTAGSLQALLNKRRLRCKGPPFLRLLEVMRFLEQMLSAVSHLLAHGVAHNDIKPDNWLLRSDQRTLVLTDFGACIDSLSPPKPRSELSPPSPAAPVPHASASAAAAAAGLRQASPAGRTQSPCRSTGAEGSTAATAVGPSASANEGAGRKRLLDADTEMSTTSGTPRWQPTSNCFLSAKKRFNVTGNAPGDVGADDNGVAGARGGKKRPHCCGDQESDDRRAYRGRGPATVKGKPGVGSTTDLSDKLVFPFSDYFVAGTPSILAPELSRAWREKTVLDFNRSDVFSVGVCLYRMLRPDAAYIDNGTGLEGKDPLENITGRFGQEAWPLPLFPANKGGCPYEISQLCRGLLEADPLQRKAASEGQSLASWFVSHLESADTKKQDAKEACATATGPAITPGSSETDKTGNQLVRPPTAGGTITGGTTRAENTCAGGGGWRYSGRKPRGASSVDPTHRRHDTLDGRAPPPLLGGVRANEECRRGQDRLGFGHAGDGNREEGDQERATWSGAAAAGRSLSEKESRLEEPDELIRCDRISHMRDFFASAAPEDLFRALHSRGWDVAAACAVFDDSSDGDGRPTFDGGRAGVPGDSTPGSRSRLWFGGVAPELRGWRGRDASYFRLPPPFRMSSDQKHSSRIER